MRVLLLRAWGQLVGCWRAWHTAHEREELRRASRRGTRALPQLHQQCKRQQQWQCGAGQLAVWQPTAANRHSTGSHVPSLLAAVHTHVIDSLAYVLFMLLLLLVLLVLLVCCVLQATTLTRSAPSLAMCQSAGAS